MIIHPPSPGTFLNRETYVNFPMQQCVRAVLLVHGYLTNALKKISHFFQFDLRGKARTWCAVRVRSNSSISVSYKSISLTPILINSSTVPRWRLVRNRVQLLVRWRLVAMYPKVVGIDQSRTLARKLRIKLITVLIAVRTPKPTNPTPRISSN
jgi:hypothetical protein